MYRDPTEEDTPSTVQVKHETRREGSFSHNTMDVCGSLPKKVRMKSAALQRVKHGPAVQSLTDCLHESAMQCVHVYRGNCDQSEPVATSRTVEVYVRE